MQKTTPRIRALKGGADSDGAAEEIEVDRQLRFGGFFTFVRENYSSVKIKAS